MARLARALGHAAAPVTASELEFFQALRLILAQARRAQPGSALLGQGERPQDEPVRLRAAAGMRYASAEVVELTQPPPPGEGEAPVRPEMTVAFMGLTGPSGVLPDHYTEMVVERRRARDEALAAFLDLFNHRTISLFYRGWARSRLPVRFEESAQAFRDPVSRLLAALLGLGLEAQAGRAAQADGAMLGLAGRLGRRVRSAGALRSLAATLVPFPCKIEEFHGRWLPIAPAERTRLAQPRPGLASFSRLGVDAVAGEQVWDAQARFRLRIGPMDLPAFRRFFEAGGVRAQLNAAVREAVGPALDFDLRLVLKREEVPRLKLGDAANPAFLGQTTWLCEATPAHDRDDAILSGAGA